MREFRFYHAYDSDGTHLCGVVANKAIEAKKMVFGSEYAEDVLWIELSVKWDKGADTSGFKVGIFDDCFVAIQRGIFTAQSENCTYCNIQSKCARFLNSE